MCGFGVGRRVARDRLVGPDCVHGVGVKPPPARDRSCDGAHRRRPAGPRLPRHGGAWAARDGSVDELGDVVAPSGPRRRVVVDTQAAVAQSTTSAHSTASSPAWRGSTTWWRCPTVSPRSRSTCWPRSGRAVPRCRSAAVTWSWRSVAVWSATSPASSRRRGTAVIDVVQVPTTLLASGRLPRSAARRGINLAGGQEPRRCLPPAVGRRLRRRHACDARCARAGLGARRGRQVRADRRPSHDGRLGIGRRRVATAPCPTAPMADGPVLLQHLEGDGVAEAARAGDLDLLSVLVAHSAAVKAKRRGRRRARGW